MSLFEQINEDLKQAMKSKNEVALRALRGIKSALLLAKTEKGGNDEVSEEAGLKILQKLAKQRKESLEIYTTQNRPDLAKDEELELTVIEKYLPAQMSEADVKEIIKNLIAQAGITSAAEMGKIMPLAMKELAGKADGKLISTLIKELLS
ncbi:MAG: GatB/YqeY domain-containing protein [Bacteroidetes bacterium]|nr:GatB/YqeY domain-containing protein [Bacteroidota bacterium]